MTTNHIDQLTEWWEGAEKGTPREGDTYIARFPSGDGYETGVVDSDGLPPGMLPNTRILARAPKPKPAWHDAVAVIAHRRGDYGLTPREVYVRTPGRANDWESPTHYANCDDLVDPVPLIEARVTDEMADRLEHHFVATQRASLPLGLAEKMLAVALGLETE